MRNGIVQTPNFLTCSAAAAAAASAFFVRRRMVALSSGSTISLIIDPERMGGTNQNLEMVHKTFHISSRTKTTKNRMKAEGVGKLVFI